MRKFLLITAIALFGTLGLSACSNNGNNQANESANQAPVTRPTDSTDIKAWQAYLIQIVQANMEGVRNTPYIYFVPDVEVTVAAGGTVAPAATAAMPMTAAPTLSVVASAGTAGIPASASSAAEALARVQDQINGVVAAGVLPGNMVVVGGPNSATTAKVTEAAFAKASAGAFNGAYVLFIGDQADEAAVKAAVEPSGATFRFAQM